jgi:peptidoglycan/xylan/chitin deacetylase (PgdA/CDA1 family)/glycosyltransferase involved in cell wall biosynthesis
MWTIDVPMLPGLSGIALAVNRRFVAARLGRIYAHLHLTAPTVLTTLPFAGWLIEGLRRRALVYYCTDDYSNWPSADWKTIRRAEAEIGRQADLVLAASRALFARHESSGCCQYYPHGVDFHHFASTQQPQAIPTALARLPGPRIGFFGLVYEKLDFGLLAAVARQFPQASVVLIGRVAYYPGWLTTVPNLHLLGSRPYEELPRYLAGLDVLLIPYAIDDFIGQSSPLKLRECLASGKPTVSVDVAECRAFQPHVRVACNTAAFLEHLRQALSEPQDSPLVGARQRAVQLDTWEQRADQLRSYLAEADVIGRNAPHAAFSGPHGRGRVGAAAGSRTRHPIGLRGEAGMSTALVAALWWFGITLYRLGLARPIRWLNRHEPRVLVYHACEESESDFTRGLRVNTPPAVLADQLDFLGQHYRVIPLERLRAGDIPDFAVVVTFDDGYKSVYQNAFPMLKARGLPATLFLVTDVIGNATMVWVNELNWLLRNHAAVARPLATGILGIAAHASAEQVLDFAWRYADPGQISSLLAKIRAAADIEVEALCKGARLYVSWDEVQDMARHGISFGNHTASHPNLLRLGEKPRDVEMERAQRSLAEHVAECNAFAYPFGHYDAACRRQAVERGFTWILGVGSANRPLDLQHVGRAPVCATNNAEFFAELEVVWPVMARLKRLLRRKVAG